MDNGENGDIFGGEYSAVTWLQITKKHIYILTMIKNLRNMRQKLQQMTATPYAIAAGVACGVAISFTPFIGLHTVLAVILAFFIRASLAAALLGTLFGNPWTFPFIWAATLFAGEKFLQSEHLQSDIDFTKTFSTAFDMIKNLNFEAFIQDVWPVLYPMIIGSIPFCLLSWIITYIIIKKLVIKAKENHK